MRNTAVCRFDIKLKNYVKSLADQMKITEVEASKIVFKRLKTKEPLKVKLLIRKRKNMLIW